MTMGQWARQDGGATRHADVSELVSQLVRSGSICVTLAWFLRPSPGEG
jgi:hypothetical protein